MMHVIDVSVGALPQPMRHPLLFPCIAVLAGSFLGVRYSCGAVFFLWVCAAVFFLWAYLLHRAQRSSRWLLPSSLAVFILTACVAFTWASYVSDHRAGTHEAFKSFSDCREDVVLCGRVLTEPTGRKMLHGGARIRFDFEVLHVLREDQVISVPPYRIRVDWYGSGTLLTEQPSFPIPEFGEGWQLNGRVRVVQTRGSFPLTVLQVRKRSGLNSRYPKYNASAAIRSLAVFRRSASRTLSVGMEEHLRSVAIIKAMTLGFRSEIPRDVMHAFRLSGTVHVFAISGLHVGIVATLLMLVLSLVPMSGRYRILIFGPLIVGYTFATGAKPSAVRACIMSLFFFSGMLLDRRADPLSSLCAAAILILAMNPLQILDLGFIFSFSCALGIILLVPVLNGVLLRIGVHLAVLIHTVGCRIWKQRFSVREVVDELPGRPSFRQQFFTRLVQALAVSIAAWIASTPITAMFFGRITPVAIVCNLFVIPLAFLIVITAAFSMLVGFVHPVFAGLVNGVNVWFAECLVFVAETAATLPGASYTVTPWGVAAVVAWYGVVLLVYGVGRGHLSRPH